MAAGCTLSKDPYPREPDCEFVYEGGNLSVGANCNGAYECASGPENPTACIGRTENGIVVNRCRSVVERAEGASCAQPDDVLVRVACQEPLRCDFRTVTCASRPSFGETCETTDGRGDTCAHGFLCDRAGTGVCITPKPIGDACNDEEECEGNACIHGACREPLVLVSEWNCEP